MAYRDLWEHIQNDQIEGLETFIGSEIALAIITYSDAQEYSWMLREWGTILPDQSGTQDNDNDEPGCFVTASYDDDIYFDTADGALVAFMEYIHEARPEIYNEFQYSPVFDSFKGFIQKSISVGYRVSVAAALTVGMIGGVCGMVSAPEEAYAIPTSIVAATADSEYTWQDHVLSYEEMESFIVADLDAATIQYLGSMVDSEGNIGEQAEFQNGVMYIVQNEAGEDRVGVSFDDNNQKWMLDDPELVALVQAQCDGSGAVSFTSFNASTGAIRDRLEQYTGTTAFSESEKQDLNIGLVVALVVSIAAIGGVVILLRKR